MAHVNFSGGADMPPRDETPATNWTLIALACLCLAIPIVALLWVSSYAKETPKLGGVPFFFWYQFLWVFLTAGLTYSAYRLVLAARPSPPEAAPGRHAGAPRDES